MTYVTSRIGSSKSFLFFILPLLSYLGVVLILSPHITRAAGNTYYVSPGESIANAVSRLQPGDTLYIRAGTYNESDFTLPAGTSWSNAVTVAGYPGEKPTLQFARSAELTVNPYGILKDLILDGIGPNLYDHTRLQNVEIKNTCCTALFPGDYSEIIGVDIHDWGIDTLQRCLQGSCSHGIYL